MLQITDISETNPKTMQIAIDGPAGAGKTTMAKMLAKQLGFIYIDTGMLYRAMAYYLKQNHYDNSPENMAAHANEPKINIITDTDNNNHVTCNDQDITDYIYTQEIGEAASVCSKIPEIRSALLSIQQKITSNQNVIMDGRDIGTVILPNANVKFYLTASNGQRAIRRLKEIHTKTNTPISSTDLKKMMQQLHERDTRDMNREIAPLKQADDAIFIDNSNMTTDQTFQIMLRICELTKQTL